MHCSHHSAVCWTWLRATLSSSLAIIILIFSLHACWFLFQKPIIKLSNQNPWRAMLCFQRPQVLPPWKLHLSFWKTWPGQSFLYSSCDIAGVHELFDGPSCSLALPSREVTVSLSLPLGWAPVSQPPLPPPPLPGSWNQRLETSGKLWHQAVWSATTDGPLLNHDSIAVSFLHKLPSESKGKAILTSDLHSHPRVESSFGLFQ